MLVEPERFALFLQFQTKPFGVSSVSAAQCPAWIQPIESPSRWLFAGLIELRHGVDATPVAVVAYRALDDQASEVEVATVLARGIAALHAVYTEIDIASIQLYTSSLVKRRSS